MVGMKPSYVRTLDNKFMILELMAHLYSDIPKIVHEQKEETKEEVKKCAKNTLKKWGMGSIVKFCFSPFVKQQEEKKLS